MYRHSRCELAAWILAVAQAIPLAICAWQERSAHQLYVSTFRRVSQAVVNARRGRVLPAAHPLPIGKQIPATHLLNEAGDTVWTHFKSTQRRALLFVSSCAPCVADQLLQYDKLSRSGHEVIIVAQVRPEQIASARLKYRLHSTILSDHDRPELASSCGVDYRPTVVVLEGQRIIYVQSPFTDKTKAFQAVRHLLSEPQTQKET